MLKKTLIVSFLLATATVVTLLVFGNKGSAPEKPNLVNTQAQPSEPTTTSSKTPEFDKKMYSLTDPTSIWFIANKQFALPATYVPSDLTVPVVPLRLNAGEEQMKIRKVAEADLLALFEAGKQAGLQLEFGSGYRSAAYQNTLYSGYVASMGQAEADKSSARPGHSEHQTGLALDFTRVDGSCHLQECFGQLLEGTWLAENAHLYGFILRYPENKQSVTGYIYEPWHYRYVGRSLAAEFKKQNAATLEEFFSLEAAPDYL